MPRVLFRNLGDGKFEELMDQGGPGITDVHASRGLLSAISTMTAILTF